MRATLPSLYDEITNKITAELKAGPGAVSAAVGDDSNSPAGLLHVVSHPQHRETRPDARAHQFLDCADGSRIERPGRFIEQQDLWPHHRRADER
jgi:hypothetical protein